MWMQQMDKGWDANVVQRNVYKKKKTKQKRDVGPFCALRLAQKRFLERKVTPVSEAMRACGKQGDA